MSTSTRPNGGGGGDVAIPSNKSNQKLVSDDYLENQVSSRSSQELSSSSSAVAMQRGISTESSGQSCSSITKSQWLTVAVLGKYNIINENCIHIISERHCIKLFIFFKYISLRQPHQLYGSLHPCR